MPTANTLAATTQAPTSLTHHYLYHLQVVKRPPLGLPQYQTSALACGPTRLYSSTPFHLCSNTETLTLRGHEQTHLSQPRSHHSHVSTKELRLQPCGPVTPLSYPSGWDQISIHSTHFSKTTHLHGLDCTNSAAISYNGASLALLAPYHTTIHHIRLGALTLPFQEARGQSCNNTTCHMPWEHRDRM